jgi:hypothetical protein
LAREAVDLAATTDDLVMHGRALMDLAYVLRVLAPTAETAPVLDAAIALFDQKGDTVDADRARARIQVRAGRVGVVRAGRVGVVRGDG